MANPFFNEEETEEQSLIRQLGELQNYGAPSPEIQEEVDVLDSQLDGPEFADVSTDSYKQQAIDSQLLPQQSEPSAETIPTPEAPKSNLNDLLQRYRDAQKSRQSGVQAANVMRSANLLSTGIAGEGAKAAPETLFKGIEDQYSLPVKDIEEEIKGRPLISKVYTEDQMIDPSSDVSKIAQQAAAEMYPNLKDKVSKLSARQLEELGFKIKGKNDQQQYRDRFRYERVRDPKTGLTRLIEINSDKGTTKDLGEAGYSYQTVVDPYTQERVPARNIVTGQTGPGAPVQVTKDLPKEEIKASDKFMDDSAKAYSQLKPIHRKQLTDLSTAYSTESKDQRNSYDSIDNITENMVEMATKNEVAASQLGAQVANIYENGRLTDEDVLRYTRRKGIISRIQDLTSELATGTITKDKAKEIKDTLKVYKQALRLKLSERAVEKVKAMTPALRADGINVDPQHLATTVYGDFDPEVLKAPPAKVKIRRKSDGRIKEVEASKVGVILNDPDYERVN